MIATIAAISLLAVAAAAAVAVQDDGGSSSSGAPGRGRTGRRVSRARGSYPSTSRTSDRNI